MSFERNDASERIQVCNYIAEEMIAWSEDLQNGMDTGRHFFVIQRINYCIADSADCTDFTTDLDQFVHKLSDRGTHLQADGDCPSQLRAVHGGRSHVAGDRR